PFHFGDRGAPGRGRAPAPIEQPVIAVVLVAPAQATNAAGTPAEDVGRLEPGELPTESSQDDLLNLHGALHGASEIGHGHLLGDQFSPHARWKRSFHVAPGSGQITYSRHRFKPSVEPDSRLAYGAGVAHTAGVVIAGAGVMGVSPASHLARLGVGPVIVLERDMVCSGSTALASGGIRHQYANRLGVELTTHSIVTYERFKDEFGVDPSFRQHG